MASVFERIAYQVAQKHAPQLSVSGSVSKYLPAARALLSGDFDTAANRALDQLLGPLLGFGLDGREIDLLGGLTLAEARRIFEECAGTEYARKNLWRIEVENLGAGSGPPINLLATDVGYAPVTITGDAVRVGSGSFDTVSNAERIEMRVTTYDDRAGSIKSWFHNLRDTIARRDGTFGLPIEYLVRVTVTHGSIIEGDVTAYTNSYVMRAGGMEADLSRREDAMEEIQMTFVQFDTFTSL